MYAILRSAANSTPLGTGPLSEGEGAAHSRAREGSEDETSALPWAAYSNKGGCNMAELDNKTIAIIATDGFEAVSYTHLTLPTM